MIRREILKEVLLDNRNEVVKHQVIPRSFQFEEFGNYVFVGIRRAGKSFLLYQRIQELLHNGHTWNEMLYVNFEDERLIGMTAADLNLILEVHAEMTGRCFSWMKFRILMVGTSLFGDWLIINIGLM
jgi:predicted AAA+ superfamily ATPase